MPYQPIFLDFDPEAYFTPQKYYLEQLYMFNTLLRIPDYQRGFAWEKTNFEQLFDDIEETIAQNFPGLTPVAGTSLVPHFMGAIVTDIIPGRMSTDVEVVDGQQRLMTLTILLAVLSDFVQDVNDVTLRNDINQKIYSLLRNPLATGSGADKARLQLDQEDTFFKDVVISPQAASDRQLKIDSYSTSLNLIRTRIIDCISYFRSRMAVYFGDRTATDYDIKVDIFSNTVGRLLTIVQIRVKKPKLAYTIFETLNKRGVELTQADLIKNEVFKSAAPADRPQTVTIWKEMRSKLPDVDEATTAYIRCHYASRVVDVKESALFRDISKYLQLPTTVLRDYVNSLNDEADNYDDIYSSDSSNAQTRELLVEINTILDVSISHILLLAGAKAFGITSQNFLELTKLTRNFCFRYFTIGTGTVSSTTTLIGRAARKLRDTSSLADVKTILLADSSDTTFKQDFKQYRAKQAKKAFYIIRQIEVHLANGAGGLIPFNRSVRQHLEHIMPETPSSPGWDHVSADREKYDLYIDRLGNFLVLEADINQAIKNRKFDSKSGQDGVLVRNYSTSALQLPGQTAGYLNAGGQWDFSSIDKRQEALADLAVQVWSLQ